MKSWAERLQEAYSGHAVWKPFLQPVGRSRPLGASPGISSVRGRGSHSLWSPPSETPAGLAARRGTQTKRKTREPWTYFARIHRARPPRGKGEGTLAWWPGVLSFLKQGTEWEMPERPPPPTHPSVGAALRQSANWPMGLPKYKCRLQCRQQGRF